MIKNRHFMFGLGCGLIVGALLLQLMLIGQNMGGQLHTREQIQQAAERAGLRVSELDEELLTEEQWQERVNEDVPALEDQEQGDLETPVIPDMNQPTDPDTPQQPEVQGEDSAGNAGQPAEDQAAVEVEYKIAGGTTLEGVANGLLQAGVIEDKDKFVEAAVARKINYKVRAGTYKFYVGEEFDSIIKKISTRNN
ncbi:hypothetical protein [Paenibacillus senegalimassiliensis]|uniref:hypothetical protein n=1 Tax=Paenibacillus senegalimassiliensis TaxID=1737426 RepID=UPI00073F5205|nr:hypothetical protein [Paenibacillus senegalimassiliensis]